MLFYCLFSKYIYISYNLYIVICNYILYNNSILIIYLSIYLCIVIIYKSIISYLYCIYILYIVIFICKLYACLSQ